MLALACLSAICQTTQAPVLPPMVRHVRTWAGRPSTRVRPTRVRFQDIVQLPTGISSTITERGRSHSSAAGRAPPAAVVRPCSERPRAVATQTTSDEPDRQLNAALLRIAVTQIRLDGLGAPTTSNDARTATPPWKPSERSNADSPASSSTYLKINKQPSRTCFRQRLDIGATGEQIVRTRRQLSHPVLRAGSSRYLIAFRPVPDRRSGLWAQQWASINAGRQPVPPPPSVDLARET